MLKKTGKVETLKKDCNNLILGKIETETESQLKRQRIRKTERQRDRETEVL